MPWTCPACGYTPIPDDVDECPQCGYIRSGAPEEQVAPATNVANETTGENEAESQATPTTSTAPAAEISESSVEAPQSISPQTTPAGQPKIIIIQTSIPELRNKEYNLPIEIFKVITIGREPENIISIPDPYISGRHAKIYYDNGKLFIEDVGSTNGTYIFNNSTQQFEKINPNEKIEIQNNTLIKLGISTIIKIEFD